MKWQWTIFKKIDFACFVENFCISKLSNTWVNEFYMYVNCFIHPQITYFPEFMSVFLFHAFSNFKSTFPHTIKVLLLTQAFFLLSGCGCRWALRGMHPTSISIFKFSWIFASVNISSHEIYCWTWLLKWTTVQRWWVIASAKFGLSCCVLCGLFKS
jgi:hypothetical protein